jgi:diguanylate cyclase (GGDEF)-like protein
VAERPSAWPLAFAPVAPPAPATDASAALIDRAWELAYLDPLQAGALGRQVAERSDAWAGWGWLHVALAEVRCADAGEARRAVERARAVFSAAGEARGTALADEVQAIVLRRANDLGAAAWLQREIDRRSGIAYTHHDRFLAHNSRAITHKLLGEVDVALHHFYAAIEAAEACGWTGPRITALCNLGGYHHDLHNLEDARALSEQALQAARAVGARPAVAIAAANLILVHYAAGDGERARRTAQFLIDQREDLVPGTIERLSLILALGHVGVGEYPQAQAYIDTGAVNAIADGDGKMLWAWLQARCALAAGNPARARTVAEDTLREREALHLADAPFDLMELHRVAADACEALGDTAAALAFVRRAHTLYEQLVGRSARARFAGLRARHELATAQRERDLALDSRRSAEDDRQRLTELNEALQAKVAETERLHEQLREQALRDPLTGLHNRRYLFEAGPAMLELARRQGGRLCVVLIDLDHFKLLNDTYGHTAGDAVLQRFANLLQRTLRRSDVACRHGGEEFVAVMPDIDIDGARAVLERLLDAFGQPPEPNGRRRLPGGSFSAGIAHFPGHGHTLEQLLSRADRALYNAKHLGRARIEQVPLSGFGTFL